MELGKINPVADLAEARAANPALDAAYKRVEDETQLYLDPVVGYFSRLIDEAREMPIAARFSRTRIPEHTGGLSGVVHTSFKNLCEADYKRAQIISHLEKLRSQAMGIVGGLHDVLMDMQAAQQD